MKSYITLKPCLTNANKWGVLERLTSILTLVILIMIHMNLYSQNGLTASFYDGTNFDRFVNSKITQDINLQWNQVAPSPGINPQECSIRWRGRLKAPKTGKYTFSARVDDGIRVWVGDQLIIDNWHLNDVGIFEGKAQMEEGQFYDLKVEYFNALIEGEVRLMWEIPSQKSWYDKLFSSGNPQTIDAQHFYLPSDYTAPALEDLVSDISNVPITKSSVDRPKERVIKKKKQHTPPPASKIKVVAPITDVVKKESPRPMLPEEVTPEVIEMFTPENVQFERAQVDILPSSFEGLDILAQFLSQNSYLEVKIEGHTDVAGDPEKNMVLSERRAYAVARYLVEKGVQPKTIEAKGMGGTKPLIRSAHKVYHPENRRVAFVISVP